ncbi:unnamed protein product [Rangifer tarandus platyrhynchus]|uniref:Uncharacterized protein n=1 Tax=Rangifer tarandus platyrhynchus TaxID=3082113 RepID=A0AC59Y999_RANTA
MVPPTIESPRGTSAPHAPGCQTRAGLRPSAGGRLAACPPPRGVPGVEAAGQADSGASRKLTWLLKHLSKVGPLEMKV